MSKKNTKTEAFRKSYFSLCRTTQDTRRLTKNKKLIDSSDMNCFKCATKKVINTTSDKFDNLATYLSLCFSNLTTYMTSSKRQSSPATASKENIKRTRSDLETAAGSSDIPPVHESVDLPLQVIVSKNLQDILILLSKLTGNNGNNADFKYPIMIGSRATAYWLPSFRLPDDWDLIATPQQAYDMVKDMETQASLDISFICQPLDKNVVKHRPMTPEIQEKMDLLPQNLYKVRGEVKGVLKFEIEITPLKERSTGSSESEYDGSILKTASAGQLFEICGANNDNDVAFIKFPIGSRNGHQCIVAPVEVLEAIKLNIGFRAYKSKRLTSPERTSQLQIFMLVRTLKTEAFRGTPGAHINLNVSNEDFLERDDNIFITRHLPHDVVHDLVKYGEVPIYDQLKTNKYKAMVSKILFEKAPYDLQIKYVKEEAMVIALERFIFPRLSSDPTKAYKFALVHICTTLTKGWFRDFAIDNYPRLATCDKDLIPLRDEILQKHPLPPKVQHDPMDIIKRTVSDLDDLVTLQKLIPLTANSNLIMAKIQAFDVEARSSDESDSSQNSQESIESDIYGGDNQSSSHEQFWTIQSCNAQTAPLLVAFSNNAYYNVDDCIPQNHFYATLSVQPLDGCALLKRNTLRQGRYSNSEGYLRLPSRPFHKLSLYVNATGTSGSWGVEDIWGDQETECDGLEQEVKMLDLEGLTEDLLMIYIIAVVQPNLESDGEAPFVRYINRCKSNGVIPVQPKNHLWLDLWRLHVKK
ncbi:hypothetical protein K501DRAFT_270010 [Backusella circina FSU 941]|nr:hypothetical protein K501DRAFT_270010 [Backusella circina FSU 941]